MRELGTLAEPCAKCSTGHGGQDSTYGRNEDIHGSRHVLMVGEPGNRGWPERLVAKVATRRTVWALGAETTGSERAPPVEAKARCYTRCYKITEIGGKWLNTTKR